MTMPPAARRVQQGQTRAPSPNANSPSYPHPSQQQTHQPAHLQPASAIKASPSLPSFNRSSSPSNFSSFFSKPSKWLFSRTVSSSRASPVEPSRTSTSSTSSRRRPTISGPTDPRPMDQASPVVTEGGLSTLGNRASRSVLDLSRTSTDMNTSVDARLDTPVLGDLRDISRKPWSKSADNLSDNHAPKLAPLNTTLGMKIEQYRIGTPGTPGSVTQKIVPFPSMPGTPSTPPNDIPVRQLRHAHSGSGSYLGSGSASSIPTPVPASPAPSTRLIPPSPIHATRKRSFDMDRGKNKSLDTTTQVGRGGAFSFYFGNPPEKKGLLGTTPTIVAQDPDGEELSKRSSQIVHRSGFVNRLSNFSVDSPNLSSSKHWKPYKLFLKGSKLYFYKPPGDRIAAVKELFPSGMVAVVEEDVEEEEIDETGRSNKEKEEARKKRAFWGRRTHPDLMTKDGKITHGTFEALMHELVFGTTYSSRSATSDGDGQSNRAWKDFSSSMIMCLPLLVDRARFEYEFQRCATYLVSGADSSEREEERARVAWLVRKYLAYYGTPVDEGSWKTFCKDVIPSFDPDVLVNDENSTLTFPCASGDPSDHDGPHPARNKEGHRQSGVANTLHALEPLPVSVSPNRSPRKPTTRVRLWSLMEQTGFTREVFTSLEPELIARSLLLYQRSIMESTSRLTADEFLAEHMASPLVDFFGNDDMPHWLTRCVIMHILGPGRPNFCSDEFGSGSGSGSEGRKDPKQVQNSKTHVRADIIARWAQVGEKCRMSNDECSWRIIMAALCSPPIARLEKAWKRVGSTALSIVRSWAYSPHDRGPVGIQDSPLTPWGGDGRHRAMKLLEKLQDGKSNEWQCDSMFEIWRLHEDFCSACNCCLNDKRLRSATGDEDTNRLTLVWKEMASRPQGKLLRIDQYMSLSLAAESKKKGLFAPYYWSRQINQGQQALIPLLFVESLPSVSLIDRSQIVRAKKTSHESSVVLGDGQTQRPDGLKCTIEPDGRIQPANPSRINIRGSSAFDLRGLMLPVFDGELSLCVVSGGESGSSSRPASRAGATSNDTALAKAPSIRVKSAAAGLDRKSSRIRRSSLPVLSQRSPAVIIPEQNNEPPLYAVVHAGTLDALVHFLVHGLEGVSVSVADDNGEMALRDKKTRAVKVDRAEFANIWWSTFRSFVAPYVFFQLLRKDYLTSCSFRKSTTCEELLEMLHSRLAVIKILIEWIQKDGGAQDLLDDVELLSAMGSFLNEESVKDMTVPGVESDEIGVLLKICNRERAFLLNTFTEQTMRPQLRHVPVHGSNGSTVVHDFGTRPPRIDDLTPEDLVNNLDSIASASFRNVNQEDLFVTADLFEIQTADRTGWYLPREPTSLTDEVEIQTLYSYIMEAEPTSFMGEFSGEALYSHLPPGVRSIIRAFTIIRKWLLCLITTPQLGYTIRQARMEMLLKAIEICRLRIADQEESLPGTSYIDRPSVRSFVEAVIASALLSPESRIFHRAWQGVANARGAQAESLLSLLSVRTVEKSESQDRLTVDPAWLFERILEVLCLPDVSDSSVETPLSLVNFEKRRQLHNVIVNSSLTARATRQRRELDRTDFERLNRMDREYGDVLLDLRTLKDDAYREAAGSQYISNASKKSSHRPFSKVVHLQQEKLKRDKYMRERLLKEKRHEQQRLERKDDDITHAFDARNNSQTGYHGRQRSKRSMSALFNLMRPISTAFTSDSGVTHRRSAAELDFTPSHKPAIVLSLVDARVMAFVNNERSFTFQLDTEDGGHYLFQALSNNDMNRWLKSIRAAVHLHAQRRLTYIGDPGQLQLSDHVQPRPLTFSRDPKAVFGVDLEFLIRRESEGDEIAPDAIPRVIEICLSEIEKRGLTEQGIYRIAGATSEVTALREALNSGQTFIEPHTDINAVCGVVKYWFRVLPETLVPEMFFDVIIEAARIPELDERLTKIRDVVHQFPRGHFNVLKRLMEHLDRVVDYEDQNHMTPDNLATVICPNLLRAPNNNFGLIMKNMGAIVVLFKALLTHMQRIFDEDEVEEEDDHAEDDEVLDALEEEETEDSEDGQPSTAVVDPQQMSVRTFDAAS